MLELSVVFQNFELKVSDLRFMVYCLGLRIYSGFMA